MKKTGIFTKTLAIAGTIFIWFPVLAPILLAVASIFEKPRFIEYNEAMMARPINFDYLMPAELFPFALLGGSLLFWAATRARSQRGMIGWGLAAAAGMLLGGQILATVTGLASGDIEPDGWQWTLVLTTLAAYCLALIIIGIGGILLSRDLFKSTKSP